MGDGGGGGTGGLGPSAGPPGVPGGASPGGAPGPGIGGTTGGPNGPTGGGVGPGGSGGGPAYFPVPQAQPPSSPVGNGGSSLPNFKIDPEQVMTDINLYGMWGSGSTMPQMRPLMNPFSMYGSQQGFNWPGYLGGFK